jgi:hypothetical protein
MVDDLKRISESREIAHSSSLTHTTIDYENKSNGGCSYKRPALIANNSKNKSVPKTAKYQKRKYLQT